MLQESFWSHHLVEDVLANMGVHCAQRIVEEEDVVVAVYRPREADPLLLSATQVDALKWTYNPAMVTSLSGHFRTNMNIVQPTVDTNIAQRVTRGRI